MASKNILAQGTHSVGVLKFLFKNCLHTIDTLNVTSLLYATLRSVVKKCKFAISSCVEIIVSHTVLKSHFHFSISMHAQ